MCVPGRTHADGTSGVVELVAVTTTSAPRIASSAAIARAPGWAAASSRAAPWSRPTFRISPNLRSAVSARRCAAACGPEPKTASTSASARASNRTESALQAEVRASVAARASSVASGRPVTNSKTVRKPWRRSSPSAWLAGLTLMTLTLSRPSSGSAPEIRNVPAPSPRSMWPRTGATAAPRETIARAAAIASATRTGSTAMISSRLKCRIESDTGFLANPGQLLEQIHRLLAARDREFEDEVAVAEPAVAEASRPPQSGARRAADEDGKPAIVVRPGREMKAREVIELAVELGLVALPKCAHGGERFVRDAGPPAMRNAHEVGFALKPAQAGANDQTTTGQPVGGREHLGEDERMPVGHDQYRGTDRYPPGDPGHV